MIREIHKRLQNKEITATELVKEYSNIIKEKDGDIKAFLQVHKKDALSKAKKIDEKIEKGKRIGLLEGIPFAVKDNICARGKRTSSASKMLDNYESPYNATVIEKLEKEGAILLGKTNLDEFAMGASTENSAFQTTKNPHDKKRVAGGSSGGSAAAVAAGMIPWALGSDTGGSIRQPAGFCGVIGFKPTYGRVSRYGLMAMASSYDQIGPLAKSIEDTAVIFDVICGKDERDNTTAERKEKDFAKNIKPSLKGKKVGIVNEFFEKKGLDPVVKDLIEERIKWAKKEGAQLVEVNLPHSRHALAVYYMMVTSEVSSNMARFDGVRFGLSKKEEAKDILDIYKLSRAEGLGDEVKRRIILGTYALSAGYFDAYYKKAAAVREIVKKEFKDAFAKVDVIISPTSPTPAFPVGEKASDPLAMYLADIYTVSSNVAMIPAISIPAGLVRKEGRSLPVGLQLLGKWWDEQNLLNIAAGFEID